MTALIIVNLKSNKIPADTLGEWEVYYSILYFLNHGPFKIQLSREAQSQHCTKQTGVLISTYTSLLCSHRLIRRRSHESAVSRPVLRNNSTSGVINNKTRRWKREGAR